MQPITLDQARAFPWPFRTPRQPIGVLIDHGEIGISDLQQAARLAYSRRLKAACAVMLTALAPPQPVKILPAVQRPTLPAGPSVCPVCGSPTWPDPRWTSRRGVGWRCEATGLLHFLQVAMLPMLKEVFSPEAWLIPPEGEYPGVRRRDLASGPMGYLPSANQ